MYFRVRFVFQETSGDGDALNPSQILKVILTTPGCLRTVHLPDTRSAVIGKLSLAPFHVIFL